MPAPFSRRLARLTLIVAATVAFASLATPALADTDARRPPLAAALEPVTQDVRPEPTTGSIGGPRVDVEPGGPAPTTATPSALNLFKADAFRYQDPNYYACTATSALVMLNLIAHNGKGGSGFRWVPRLALSTVESILAWERTHDTLAGGNGSDPHGWRNALNYYGWGSGALSSGSRVYDDFAYSSYARAVKNAVRQLIRTRKPVGILAWGGRHAQFITGYDGLSGNPFAKDGRGRYTNQFTVASVYLSDPLKSDGWVNAKVSYSALGSSTNAKLRFVPYGETDSPYDDPYTAGTWAARDEWLNRWVIIAPIK
ncbi:MAG TPA: hypothetical protein VFO05_04445 [Candidatus Limnocylindrales bacterium]|nr:hypothetical protein [Candidatus Limnocylindrales bacterium]